MSTMISRLGTIAPGSKEEAQFNMEFKMGEEDTRKLREFFSLDTEEVKDAKTIKNRAIDL